MSQGAYQPPRQDYEVGEISEFHTWNADQLGLFFRKKGLGEYSGVLRKHKITGQLAPLLEDADLKEIGIDVVGDRLMFKHHLKDLSRRDRFIKRMEILWQGEEQVFFSPFDRSFFTCWGMCPVDPSTYSLRTNHLRVKKVQPVRCGPVRLWCFGAYHHSNNIDLSKVDDVDVYGVPAPCVQRTCCCARGKDRIDVESRFENGGEKITLVLEEGHGEQVAAMILNQVEESQQMDRGSSF